MRIKITFTYVNACVCAFLLINTPLAAIANESIGTIAVSGESEVKVAPDEVVITLGIETRNKDLAEVKRLHDNRLKDVITRIAATGVANKDIQTDYVRLEPEYNTNPTPKLFLNYLQQTTLVVTLRDVSKFEALLTAALKAGVEFVHGVDFQTSELRKHRDQARILAVKAAKEKAVAMATELGQKVGKPRSIQEGYFGWVSSYGRWWGRGFSNQMSQNVSLNMVQSGGGGAGANQDSLAPGTLSVRANVSITFDLE